MREALAPLAGQRVSIRGRVGRFGCRPIFANLYGETVLLEDVTTATGAPLADHVWLPLGMRLAALDLRPGDILTLSALVKPYVKHQLVQRRNGKYQRIRATPDFKLIYPSRLHKIAQEGV